MDKDIRDFLDRAEQKRLYEEKRKRKEKRLANHIKRQKRKAHRNTALNGADIFLTSYLSSVESNISAIRAESRGGKPYTSLPI